MPARQLWTVGGGGYSSVDHGSCAEYALLSLDNIKKSLIFFIYIRLPPCQMLNVNLFVCNLLTVS